MLESQTDCTYAYLRQNLGFQPAGRAGKFAIPTLNFEISQTLDPSDEPTKKIEWAVPSAQNRMLVGVIGIFG